MSALQDWKDRIAVCRQSRDEPAAQTWQRLAANYDNWVCNNNYVKLALPYLEQKIDSSSSVLEIGPGTGGFTLPLAKKVNSVVAVEPSQNMRDVLSQKMASSGVDNVRLVPHRAEDGLTMIKGAFDLALASYSVYDVAPVDQVVREMVRLASHSVFLMGTGEQPTWYRSLYTRFKGREAEGSPQLGPFYNVLLEMGIYADVRIIPTSSNYVYGSESEMVSRWMSRFRLGEERRASLRAALLERAEWRDGRLGIFGDRRMAMICIDR